MKSKSMYEQENVAINDRLEHGEQIYLNANSVLLAALSWSGMFQFQLLPGILFQNKCRTRILVTYWCMKKNLIVNWINHGIDFDPGLIPCIKDDCPNWKKQEGRGWSPLSFKRGYYLAISGYEKKRGGEKIFGSYGDNKLILNIFSLVDRRVSSADCLSL